MRKRIKSLIIILGDFGAIQSPLSCSIAGNKEHAEVLYNSLTIAEKFPDVCVGYFYLLKENMPEE